MENWCTCGNMGRCLGCDIEKKILECYGKQGLAFLREHLKKEDNSKKEGEE